MVGGGLVRFVFVGEVRFVIKRWLSGLDGWCGWCSRVWIGLTVAMDYDIAYLKNQF